MRKLFLLLMLLTFETVCAQNSSNYFIPTFYPKGPNAAALTKFGGYQVNLFTGLPDISIPLYTIESGDIKVPISLSYHASGIRISDVASWVGIGWSLSTGGTISRKVMGGPDDGIGGYLMNNLRNVSSINLAVNSDMDFVDRVVNGVVDERPDIYSYDFPGHSGKFFFDGTNNMKPALIPYAPISIKNTTYTGNHYLQPDTPKFTILDEHGVKYTFGYNVKDITQTATQTHSGVPTVSSWPLETIMTQNKRDTVTFNYGNQTINYPDATSETDIVDDLVYWTGNGTNNTYTAGYTKGPLNTTSSVVSEKWIRQINFKNGKVVFQLDSSAYRHDVNQGVGGQVYPLKLITVYKYNFATKLYETQKTIRFYTSYFNPGMAIANQRLKLDSIQVLDAAGGVMQHYRFTYNTAISFPAYNSLQRDYWGFYNGKNNTSLTPQMTIPFSAVSGGSGTLQIGSAVANGRNADSTFMQVGVLTSISYPSGGHTDFTYQTNQYMDNGVLQQAGGLRVATIKSYDNVNSTPLTKTYVYDANLAKKNFILDYCFFSVTQSHRYYEPYSTYFCPQMTSTKQTRTFVSNPRLDLEPFDAAAVVYPKVTEYIGTPASNIGKTEYNFSFVSDYQLPASMVGTPVVVTAFYQRGRLLSKTEYSRKSDGSYQPVRLTTNSYSGFPETHYAAVGLVAGKKDVDDGSSPGPIYYNSCSQPTDFNQNSYQVQNYEIVSDDNYLTSTSVQVYDQNNPAAYTITRTDYKYDNIAHQQPTRIYQTDSKGNTHITRNKYPADYLPSPVYTTTYNTILDSMLVKNMQNW